MSKKRLLVIEDDSDVAEMLYVYFAGQGYEVFNALNGNDGVAMARSKSPNLILLDVMLPDMDGFDVCRILRTTTLTKFIPITFLTQRDRRADKVTGLELGADDYITKPFDIEELRLRVQASLRRASREAPQDLRTGLPTSLVIEEMHRELEQQAGWTHLDIVLIGFKEFREEYGFVAADEVLSFAGQTLIETIAEKGSPRDFTGTYQEDKFKVFTFADDALPLARALRTRFNDGVKKFYKFSDTERGYLLVNAGTENQQNAPLMEFVIFKFEERLTETPKVENTPAAAPDTQTEQPNTLGGNH